MLRQSIIISAASAMLFATAISQSAVAVPGSGLKSAETDTLVLQVAKKKKKPSAPSGPTCSGTTYIEVGAGRPTEAWARSSARKAWTRKVLLQLGERFTDIDVAQEVKWVCAKTGSTRILTRCEVSAKPCPTTATTQ